MSNECCQSILPDYISNTESQKNVHLSEIATKFLLGHLVDATHDMFISFSDCFSYALEVPRVSWCTDCEPSFVLPLISLLTCCCTCLCTQLLCHTDQLSDCGGYPTCSLPTNMAYMKGIDEQKSTPTGCFTSLFGLSELQESLIHLRALVHQPSFPWLQQPCPDHQSERLP